MKRPRAHSPGMHHTTLLAQTVVGEGANSILLEPRGHMIRVKPRGQPAFFVSLEVAGQLGAALAAYARNAAMVRA